MRRWLGRIWWGVLIVCILATSVAYATSWRWPQQRLWWWIDSSNIALDHHFEVVSASGGIQIQRYAMGSRQSSRAGVFGYQPMPSALTVIFERRIDGWRLAVPYWFVLGLLLTMAFLTWWRGRIGRARRMGDDIEH